MCLPTRSASDAAPENTASVRPRSLTAPATSPIITGGSASTTGICETPYVCRISMASRTVSVGCVCTRSGSAPDLVHSTSATVAPWAALWNPYDRIQASLKIFDR